MTKRMPTQRIGRGMAFKVAVKGVKASLRTEASAVTLATSRGYVDYQSDAYSGVERDRPRLILSFPVGPWIRRKIMNGVERRVTTMHSHGDVLYQASNN